MNDVERKFLLAVERGDLDTLKSLLNDSNNRRRLDINCCDPLARNALVIAIDNENLEMVKILIQAGIRIGDAILYAIDENFVEAVELLLDYDLERPSKADSHSWEQSRENSFFSPDMTPLILAAHRNNFEVIKILLDRQVSPIPDPHCPRCDCEACSKAREEDCLKHSRSKINAYRALASPCLMALSSPDPLLTAFEMSAKLENLAKMEPEYKQDYLKLRKQCQTFATKLMDHTRTSRELEILLNYSDENVDEINRRTIKEPCEPYYRGSLYEMSTVVPSTMSTGLELTTDGPKTSSIMSGIEYNGGTFPSADSIKQPNKDSVYSLDSVTGKHESYRSQMRLARLRLAIVCKQKTFCAHPNIQELLATMWYENLPGFRRRNAFAQIIQVILIGLMFPVYSVAYLVAPRSQLGRYIKKPFIKFICHSASYITFLVVLILASQRVEAFYNWTSVIRLFSFEDDARILQIIANKNSNLTLNREERAASEFDLYNNTSKLDAPNNRPFSTKSGQTTPRGLSDIIKIFEQLPASSKKRGSLPSPIELVILTWVLALIWAEIKQVKSLGINYYKADMWNLLDSVASGFYIGAIILRFISFIQSDEQSIEVAREHWHAYDPTLLSEGLFAAATIFSALKIVYIFSVNPYLGPLQISLGRMIIDILRFSWIYMLVLFSFACGMNQLLWYYADLERHHCLNVTNYSLAQYYSTQQELLQQHTKGAEMVDVSMDEGSIYSPVTIDDSCKTWRYFSNVFESSQTLFWATFGLVDLENFDLTGIRQYTRFWALLMFGCYCFINVIVVLNLLIAMMNHSYVKISKKSDIEWKFARTRLWMSYFDTGSTVPAPFNLVPSIKSIRRQLTRKKKNRETYNRRALTLNYRHVMRSLVRRYLLSEQRLLERKRELTEAKLHRWAKLNAVSSSIYRI